MRPRRETRERSSSSESSDSEYPHRNDVNQDQHRNNHMRNVNRLYDDQGSHQRRPKYAMAPYNGPSTSRNSNNYGYYSDRSDNRMDSVNRCDNSGFDRRMPERPDWQKRCGEKRQREFDDNDHHDIPYKQRREVSKIPNENAETGPQPVPLLSLNLRDFEARQSSGVTASSNYHAELENRRRDRYHENYYNQVSSFRKLSHRDEAEEDLRKKLENINARTEKLNRTRGTATEDLRKKLNTAKERPVDEPAEDLRNKLNNSKKRASDEAVEDFRNMQNTSEETAINEAVEDLRYKLNTSRERSMVSKSIATKKSATATIQPSQTTRKVFSDNQERPQEEMPAKKLLITAPNCHTFSKASGPQVTHANQVKNKNTNTRSEISAEPSTSGSSDENPPSAPGSSVENQPSTSDSSNRTIRRRLVRSTPSGIVNRPVIKNLRVVLDRIEVNKFLRPADTNTDENSLVTMQNKNEQNYRGTISRDSFKQIKFLYYLRNRTYRNMKFSLITKVQSSINLSNQLFLFERDTKNIICEAKCINIAGLPPNINKNNLTYKHMSGLQFDLKKYFKIFLDWKMDSTRRELQKIIIYCNFGWNKIIFQKNKVTVKEDKENLTKFEIDDKHIQNHDWYKKILSHCPMLNLAKEIIRIMRNEKVNFNSKLMKQYIGALVKECVIEIKKVKSDDISENDGNDSENEAADSEDNKKGILKAIFHKHFLENHEDLTKPIKNLRRYVTQIVGHATLMSEMFFIIPHGSDVSTVISDLFYEEPKKLFKDFFEVFRYGHIEDDFNQYDEFLPSQLVETESAEFIAHIHEHTLKSIQLDRSLEETTQSLNTMISKNKVIKKSLNEVVQVTVNFHNESLIAMKNKLGNGQRRIIHLCLTESVLLTTLLVKQVSKSQFSYEENEEALFIKSETLLEMTDSILDALSVTSTKLLAIQWNDDSYDEAAKLVYGKIQNFLNTLQDDIKKSVIIIAKSNSNISELSSVKIFDNENSFSLTEESQNEVLQLEKVMFQDHQFKLLDLMNEQAALDFIKIPKVLESLVHEKLNFGSEFSKPSWLNKNYFESELKQQVIIDQKIFKDDLEEVFCIKNIDNRKLRELIPQNQEIYDSKKFPAKAKFILMDPHIDNYSLIFDHFQRQTVHIFNYVDCKFVWQTTRGSIKSLLKYKIDDYDVLSNSKAIDDVLNSRSKTIIISGDSGMGKSTHLYNLAESLYNKSKSELDSCLWVIYTTFEKLNMKVSPKTTDEAIELLAIHLGLKNEQKKLFFMSANGELKIKIVLFIDGCDDLPSEDLKVPIILLQTLQKSNIQKIFVTTRRDFTLENELDVFSYQLQFSQEQKIQFLQSYWGTSDDVIEKAKNFIQKYENLENPENDFTYTPLHLKMLAEINKDESDLITVNSFRDLYKQYIELKVNEEQLGDIEKLLTQKIMRDKIIIECQRNESDLPIDFAHITFAEYFIARSLSTCINTPSYNLMIPLIDNTFIDGVSRVFLGTLLPLLKTNRKIQTFMNKLAQDGYLQFLKMILKSEVDAKPCLHELIKSSHHEKSRNFKNTTYGTLSFILKHYNSTGDYEIMKHGEVKPEYLDSNIVNYVNSEKENLMPIQIAAAQNRSDLACELLLYGANILMIDNTDFIFNMASYVIMKIIAGENRFYSISEKLLMLIPPEEAVKLCKQNYFNILAYFFKHGRIKIIKRLLPGPEERTEFLKQCPEDELPVNLINKSQDLTDEKRWKMIQYISNNFGEDSITKNIDQVLRAACHFKHWHAFTYSIGTHQIEFLKSILLNNEHDILEFLKGRGKTYLTDKNGNTAVHISITMGLSPWTISKAADICGVDDCNNDGRTALHTAFLKGISLSQIKYLIDKKKASLFQKDNYGLYPWCYLLVEKFSRYNQHEILEMMDYLLPKGIEAPNDTESNFVNDAFIREVKQKFKYYLDLKNMDSDYIEEDIPPLHLALKDTGKETWCNFLINQIPNINDTDSQVNSNLHIALHNKRYKLAKSILRRGVIIDSVDENGLTSLQILTSTSEASDSESYKKVKNLLELAEKIFTNKDIMRDNLSKNLTQFDKLPIRFLISCRNKKHQNLYHIAASFGSASTIVNLAKFNKHCIENYKVFEPLVIDQQDDDGNSPMHIAANKKHRKVIEDLLRYGARYNITNDNGKMPIDLATDKSVFQAADELFTAVKSGEVEKVRDILESKKYLVNARDEFGRCSLHYANDTTMMKLLIQNLCTLYKHQEFADIDVVDSNFQSPLYCAAEKDNLDCAKLLLRAGDSFELKNFKGENNSTVQLLRDIEVLFEDVKSDDPQYFTNENAWHLNEYLKNRCRDVIVNARDDKKDTLLHYAAKYNFTKAIEVLLKNGAIYNVKNRKDHAPKGLDMNAKNLFESVDELFKNLDLVALKELDLDKQIIVNCRTRGGYTLLHKVVKLGKQDEKEWLIEEGANVEDTNDFGIDAQCDLAM